MAAVIRTGKFTGSNAAQVLELGFIPDFYMGISLTDNAVKTYIYEKNMTDATGVYLCEGDDDLIDSNGFTPYTGGEPTVSSGTTPGASKGLTIGTSGQQNGVVCHYIAICNG
jgi:hypothetical protein